MNCFDLDVFNILGFNMPASFSDSKKDQQKVLYIGPGCFVIEVDGLNRRTYMFSTKFDCSRLEAYKKNVFREYVWSV